jgi:hypothetical protein
MYPYDPSYLVKLVIVVGLANSTLAALPVYRRHPRPAAAHATE